MGVVQRSRRNRLVFNAGGVLITMIICMAQSGCALIDADESERPPLTWNQTHRVDLPPGWTVTQRNVGPVEESTSLSGPGSTGCLVWARSARPQWFSWPRSQRVVGVQGHRAVYGTAHPDYGPYPRKVIWQPSDGRWLGVECDLDQAGVLGIAERLRTAANPIRVPFELLAVPDRLTMTQVIDYVDGDDHFVSAQFDVPGTELGMSISNGFTAELREGSVERRTIAGSPVEIRRATQTIRFTDSAIYIQGPGYEPASDWSPEALRLALRTAALLRPVDNTDDEANWIDADDAFP
jgi:hypothetical protein